MQTYGEILEDDAADYLSILGGESINYLPSGGGSRAISAIVDRRQPTALDAVPHGTAPLLTIQVLNDATDGISSSEINIGRDKVEVSERIGQAAQQHRFTKILSQDLGMMKLEVR